MQQTIPTEFSILLCGPFNTRLKMDYTQLSNYYDDFRRKTFKILTKKSSDQRKYYIERFQHEPQKLDNWLNEKTVQNTKLLFKNPQGVTHRDSAIFSANIKQPITPKESLFSEISDYFSEAPTINNMTLKFQENGIGTFSCYIKIALLKSPSINTNEYKNFMQKLRDSFVLSEELINILNQCDQDVYASAKKAAPKIVEQKTIIDSSDLYGHEKDGFPLWGHAVALFDFDFDGPLPFGSKTKNALIVSHPDGLVDMNSLSDGFVHLGWGLSLTVGILPEEINKLKDTLIQLQFYWRSAQVLNDLVMKYLEKYTELKKFAMKNIKESMDEIENLTVESELFFSYHMDYLKMLSPLSHYLYKETEKSWRINDMIDYFENKKDALAHLHEQGQARLKENLEQKRNKMSDRLNILLSILALLTLFSWAADSIGFLDATLDMLPNLKPILIGGKFVVIVLTPILVIGIFMFFFRVTTQMEKLED